MEETLIPQKYGMEFMGHQYPTSYKSQLFPLKKKKNLFQVFFFFHFICLPLKKHLVFSFYIFMFYLSLICLQIQSN